MRCAGQETAESTLFKRADLSVKIIESTRNLPKLISSRRPLLMWINSSLYNRVRRVCRSWRMEIWIFVVSGKYRHARFCLRLVYCVFWLCGSGRALVRLSESIDRDDQDCDGILYFEFSVTSHPSLKPPHHNLRPSQQPHFIPKTAQATPSRIIPNNHLLDVPDARNIIPG